MPQTVTRPDASGRFEDFVVIQPREVPLGGPRAMTVHRTLPARDTSLVGSLVFRGALRARSHRERGRDGRGAASAHRTRHGVVAV